MSRVESNIEEKIEEESTEQYGRPGGKKSVVMKTLTKWEISYPQKNLVGKTDDVFSFEPGLSTQT